jgi:Tfp pilus assembly protein PilZ
MGRSFVNKRTAERVPIKLALRFPCCKMIMPGTVTDISETGLFFNTETCFPVDSNMKVFIKLKNEILKVPVEIVRIVRSNSRYKGIGVRILDIPKKYLELLIKLHLDYQS